MYAPILSKIGIVFICLGIIGIIIILLRECKGQMKMSSVNSRIIIDHYVNGGLGVFIDGQDKMGLRKEDVHNEVYMWLRGKK